MDDRADLPDDGFKRIPRDFSKARLSAIDESCLSVFRQASRDSRVEDATLEEFYALFLGKLNFV